MHVSRSMLDLLTTPLLSTPEKPTTLHIDHHILEFYLIVLKPTRLTRRVCYRKYSSIDKRIFATDIYNAFAVISGTTVELIDNYNTIVTIMDKHAPIITHIVTVRPKTPWHMEELSCAKHYLHRAVVHRQIYMMLRDTYRRQLATIKASHFCTVIHEAGHEDNVWHHQRTAGPIYTRHRHFTSSSLTRFKIYAVPSSCMPSQTLSIDSRLM